MTWDLEAILDFEMDELQSKAFKLSLLWEIMVEKEFPNYEHVQLRQKGDPRKSHLFRQCYKLVRDTKGLIPDREYRLYMLAQLHVLKHLGNNTHIDPRILTGDKAWVRWKIWKNRYDKNYENYKQTLVEAQPVASQFKVLTELKKTKSFFVEKFGHHPTENEIDKVLKDHSMVKWVTLKRVSPYYVLLSPWIAKILEGRPWQDVFLFDLSVYEASISPEIESYFKQEFDYECGAL